MSQCFDGALTVSEALAALRFAQRDETAVPRASEIQRRLLSAVNGHRRQ